ncbi:MAG: aldolase [Saprospiraceae bacterium]|nr:aldolase [Saprospiraceae bacterium]
MIWFDERPNFNMFLSIPSPYLIEVLHAWPVDSFTIDRQHGQFDAAHVRPCIRACKKPVLIRLAANDPTEIGKSLDYGAAGLICPMIENVAATQAFVEACYYPPFGKRSYGPVRVSEPEGYFLRNRQQDDHILTFAMIETQHALEQVEQIAQVPRLTGLYIGPFDLSVSMGLQKPGDYTDPLLQAAISKVYTTCQTNQLKCGIFSPNPNDARNMAQLGMDLISLGLDEQWITQAGKQLIPIPN